VKPAIETVPTVGESLCTVKTEEGDMMKKPCAWRRKIYLDLNFIISWGEGEDGRFGGGVTINDG